MDNLDCLPSRIFRFKLNCLPPGWTQAHCWIAPRRTGKNCQDRNHQEIPGSRSQGRKHAYSKHFSTQTNITNLWKQQLSIRLEEVEVNAVAGSRRIISKLEARLRDIEAELEEERRKHAETIKILRKKERSVKEVYIQIEEDQKNIQILQDALEKSNQKIAAYKRQLVEQVI